MSGFVRNWKIFSLKQRTAATSPFSEATTLKCLTFSLEKWLKQLLQIHYSHLFTSWCSCNSNTEGVFLTLKPTERRSANSLLCVHLRFDFEGSYQTKSGSDYFILWPRGKHDKLEKDEKRKCLREGDSGIPAWWGSILIWWVIELSHFAESRGQSQWPQPYQRARTRTISVRHKAGQQRVTSEQ